MRLTRPLLAAAALCALVAPAQAFMGKCVLNVGGKNYLDGPCEIEMIDKEGSFTIGASDKSPSPYFAYVVVTRPGVAEGSWNRDPKSTHAHATLGTLKKRGACWVNGNARVCAAR
jgi:hypothetical protein